MTISTAEFEDSVQATEAIEDLYEAINDPRIHNWLEATDHNYHDSQLSNRYAQLRVQLTEVLDDFFSTGV